jgi:hypothetical protein
MIVLLGSQQDPYIWKTFKTLQKREAQVILIDAYNLLKSTGVNYLLACSSNNSFLMINSQKIQHQSISCILARIGEQVFQVDSDMTPKNQLYSRYEIEATLKALLRLLDSRVINGKRDNQGNIALFPAHARTKQAIAECGLQAPKRLFTSNYHSATLFYNGIEQRAILSSPLRRISRQLIEGQEGLDQLKIIIGEHPICLEEAPLGQWLHAFIVGNKVFGVPWRVDDKKEIAEGIFSSEINIKSQLQVKCLKLARTLNLDFAQLSLLLRNQGDEYCFEVSDFPNYEFSDEHLQEEISDALAELLVRYSASENREAIR